jgi:hypothetical protein
MRRDDVTVIVKTILRPDCLRTLAASLFATHPKISLVVCDDSPEPYAPSLAREHHRAGHHFTVATAPFDIGAAAGRNLALSRVQTPLFLSVDDDHTFDHSVDLTKMMAALDDGNFDIAGGAYREPNGLVKLWTGWFDRAGDTLSCVPIDANTTSQAPIKVHCVQQFLLARTTSVLRMGGWDKDLKTSEHTEFFLRAQHHGLSVCHVDGVALPHKSVRPSPYSALRTRNTFYRRIWMRKYGIRTFIDFHGAVFHAHA